MNISCVRYNISADVVLRVVLRQDSVLLYRYEAVCEGL